jgi:glycosyltransferase involved in cell wall biosynthesis
MRNIFKGEKMKIGFVSNLYYTFKGHSYVTELLVKTVLEAGHEAHMFRIGDNPVIEEFAHPTTLRTCKDKIIPHDDFKEWLETTLPEICIFNEYSQWWEEDHNKLEFCEKLGIKTIGYLVTEKIDKSKVEDYKLYTHIICPTLHQRNLLRKMGCYNAVYVPWGDYDYKNVADVKYEGDKIVFLHVAGSGGVDDRKNTNKVIEAYKRIADTTTDLKITHLSSKAFSRAEILGFTKAADVIINASKWDTIGLLNIESNKLGVPVIVADAEPMNELVKNRYNGLTVEAKTTTSPFVNCPVHDVDVDELAKAMSICKNKDILDFMKKSAKKWADEKFDWNKNKEKFLELLK